MSTGPMRSLGDVGPADASDVGGKAASLGELIAAGVRVPDGVVIAASALDAVGLDTLSTSVADRLGTGPFAVRSSAIGEDGAERSFAGMFESVLDVAVGDVPVAVERVLASAHGERAARYGVMADGCMAVVIQRMVTPVAAGVALTADPISGDRSTTVVTAVRGTGDRLVSGAAIGDEWVVGDRTADARRQPERALDRRRALDIARVVRRIEELRGAPQDVEWAIDADGTLWILQARPMTALPPDVSWAPPAPGAFTRTYRLGEWIAAPVTPLFESWLLTALEERLHARLDEWIGQRAPRPFHVVVNGWYFYSVNFFSPSEVLRTLPRLLVKAARSPRRVAGLVPPLMRHSIPVFEREWREQLLPRYRSAVAQAEARVEAASPVELVAVVDGLAAVAGDVFASIAALAGSASKAEVVLARFHRRHVAGSTGRSHLPLLAGLRPPDAPGAHGVTSLDWWEPMVAPSATGMPAAGHDRLVAEREAAEAAAAAALASSRRRLAAFRRLLELNQHLAVVREEQVGALTLGWPVMRRAVLRLGEHLAAAGALADADDVFFLEVDELRSALDGPSTERIDVGPRRAAREEHAGLRPPLTIGRMNPMLRRLWAAMPVMLGAEPSDRAIVTGAPASAGRATGTVRIVRGASDFDALQPGEVLVAPLTAPAWTPLFARAAAVVTDVGSPAAHASIIAREYGIPAVVGCGDATARLRDGMAVIVDGTTGNVEPAA